MDVMLCIFFFFKLIPGICHVLWMNCGLCLCGFYGGETNGFSSLIRNSQCYVTASQSLVDTQGVKKSLLGLQSQLKVISVFLNSVSNKKWGRVGVRRGNKILPPPPPPHWACEDTHPYTHNLYVTISLVLHIYIYKLRFYPNICCNVYNSFYILHLLLML